MVQNALHWLYLHSIQIYTNDFKQKVAISGALSWSPVLLLHISTHHTPTKATVNIEMLALVVVIVMMVILMLELPLDEHTRKQHTNYYNHLKRC